jgi:phosphoglycolate phosphatase
VRVVFDLDGTLIDSAPDIRAVANVMLRGLDRRELSLAETRSFVGRGAATVVRRALTATGGVEGVDEATALAAFHAAYETQGSALATLFPGAAAALGALKDRGARLAICTNKPEAAVPAALADAGLAPFFDVVVGGGALPLKPHPAMLQAAFDRLGGPGVYVGDSETDAETAAAAGAPFALFTGGYRVKTVEELAPAFAFDDFAALPGWIMAHA